MRGIFFRYIGKEILSSFAIALFAFTAMLLVINMLRFASLVVSKGVSLWQIVSVFGALVPTFLEIALPMSVLLGVMVAFARLSGDSELVVARASGLSLFQLGRPVVLFSIMALLLGAFVSTIARPWGYKTLNELLFEIASRQSTAALEAGVFSRMGPLTIYSSEIDHLSGKLSRVLIDDRRNPAERKIIVADRGTLLSDPSAQIVVFKLEEGVIHEEGEGRFSLTRFETNRLAIDPQDFAAASERKGRNFQSMNFSELETIKGFYRDLLDRLRSGESLDARSLSIPFGQQLTETQLTKKEVKKRLNRAKLEQGRRFSMPVAALLMAFVGMALGVQPPRTQRTWGLGLSALLGVSVFLLYYAVLSIGIALAEGGTLHSWGALWIPNILIATIAVHFTWNIGHERWETVLDGLERFARGIRRLFLGVSQ